ncbi:2'-5' RNA ligase family protein [Dyadobacter subterraneus]|uniref:2'-5' RNA ligase family protein n=1 Tax=Dyadobacter subterraneus TaxID=2773304 RepID=A0ABR9WFS8_9BACT|nr:2'-5' RNA ligase family protein [Dyadobacter subterraneus]MBE9464282.1 2'-5' RNA ligase family protein [Dyadobacter subterraneus]
MENLYFLAITPPEEISKEIIEIQEDIAARFDSRASLKVMPHITLKAPFKFPMAAHIIVLEWFENLQINQSAFNLELKDYGAFHNKNKPVIFIKPEKNASLATLQKQILSEFENAFPGVAIMDLELDFHPHLTIAYRDLKVNLFQEAWREFQAREFLKIFEVNDFHLLQHDGKKWNIIRTFPLKFFQNN